MYKGTRQVANESVLGQTVRSGRCHGQWAYALSGVTLIPVQPILALWEYTFSDISGFQEEPKICGFLRI